MIQDNETTEFGIFTGDDIYRNVPPSVPVIEGIINQGDNVMISSKAGVGKSILALQLVACLTSGTKFLDTFPVNGPHNVLYVQTESSRAETVHRLRHMKKALAINDGKWAHYNAIGVTLNTSDGYSEFINTVRSVDIPYDVIIIDPLYATVKGSLCSDELATDWQRALRYVKSHYPNVAYIVFHHDSVKEARDSKGNIIEKATEDIFGTSMWGAWISSNFKLIKTKDGRHILIAGKGGGRGRSGQGVSEIHMRLMEPTPLFYVIDDTYLNETETKLLAVMSADTKRMYRRTQLEDVIEKSKATVCRAVATLMEAGKIERIVQEGLTYYKAKEVHERFDLPEHKSEKPVLS